MSYSSIFFRTPTLAAVDQPRLVRNLPSVLIFGVTWAVMLAMFLAAALIVLVVIIPFSPVIGIVAAWNKWGSRLCDWWWEQSNKGRKILFPNDHVHAPAPNQSHEK